MKLWWRREGPYWMLSIVIVAVIYVVLTMACFAANGPIMGCVPKFFV